MRVDAHHHLWRYTPEEYDWIDDSMEVLRRDFSPRDLQLEAAAVGIDAAVAVQARQTLEETLALLQAAAVNGFVRGVVGWAPIAAPDFPATLDSIRDNLHLKGLRHVVQGEPAGFLDGPAFNCGIASLTGTGLVYDILIFARQLQEATRFVDRHPNQSFVLDHIAKPEIVDGNFAPWAAAIGELARRTNVTCKLSGMVTEADWQHWTPTQLQPYFDTVLEAFTPSRLMFGSDWPVVTVACTYARWHDTVANWTAALTPTEQSAIFGDTATRTYRLHH